MAYNVQSVQEWYTVGTTVLLFSNIFKVWLFNPVFLLHLITQMFLDNVSCSKRLYVHLNGEHYSFKKLAIVLVLLIHSYEAYCRYGQTYFVYGQYNLSTNLKWNGQYFVEAREHSKVFPKSKYDNLWLCTCKGNALPFIHTK